MDTEATTNTARIHIDNKDYVSPDPTTGKALYDLAGLGKQLELYREVPDSEEGQHIPDDGTIIDLRKGDRFHSEKVFSILVNQDEHDVSKKKISYAQIVDFYLGGGGTPSNEYLVKYSHGPAQNPSGTLAPGQKVMVKDGMRFRVAGTGES